VEDEVVPGDEPPPSRSTAGSAGLYRAERAARARAAAEAHARTLFETAPDAIVVADAAGRLVLANAQTERWFGYTREELLGQPVELLVPEGLRRAHVHHRTAYTAAPRTRLMGAGLGLAGRRKDGGEFPVEISLSPMETEAGTLITAVIRDVSERRRAEAVRAAQAAQLRAQAELLDLARDAIFVRDPATATIRYWNRGAEALYGWSSGEALGATSRALLKTRFPRPFAEIEATLLREGYWEGELVHTTRGGRELTVASRWALRRDEAGRPAAILELNTDVTERRRAEEEARLLRAVLLAVGEAEPEAALATALRAVCRATGWALGQAWVPSGDGELLECSPAWHREGHEDRAERLERFRRAGESVRVAPGQGLAGAVWATRRPRWVRDVRHDELVLPVRRAAARAAGLGAALAVPVLAGGDGGEPVAVLELFVLEPRDEDERLVGVVAGVAAQLGAVFLRKRLDAERAHLLRRAEAAEAERARLLNQEQEARAAAERAAARTERLQALTAALSDARTPAAVAALTLAHGRASAGACDGFVAVVSADGRELEMLPSVGPAGPAGPEAPALEAWQHFPLAAAIPAAAAVRARRPVLLESQAALRDRFPEFAATRAHPGHHARAAVPLVVGDVAVGVLALSFDAPRRFDAGDVEFLAALAGQCAQALERTRLLEAERRAREAAERLKDEFFANVSHDLRTPVTAIKASVGVVLANEPPGLPAPLHRMLVNVDLAADRMVALVADLLELTRLQAGRVQLAPERHDLRALARRAAAGVEPLAQARGQRLELALPRAPVWAEVDAGRLERALLNLLSNAHKYGRAGGAIRLGLARRPGEAVLSVADDGPGIPAADRERVFERFYRSATAAGSPAPGSGLGLAIARAMAELHGGRLWVADVADAPGPGATFCLAVPLPPARGRAEARAQPPGGTGEAGGA
jgi:PAS domain S-box-containing protein